MNKKTICGITGHTGSIGKHFVETTKKFKFVRFKGDITKKNSVDNWIKKNKFDLIIHLAAIVPIKNVNRNKRRALEVNTLGTRNLVNSIIKNKSKIGWFFLASTSHVYSSQKKKIKENFKVNPLTYYGKTKYLAEREVIKLSKMKMNYCIGRIFSTTNINQRTNYFIPDIKKKIKNSKKKLILSNLNHYRDFISISDISKIIFVLWEKKFKGILNIATGKSRRLDFLAKIIAKKYKKKIIIKKQNQPTYLIANNKLLKKIYKKKINTNIKKMIF